MGAAANWTAASRTRLPLGRDFLADPVIGDRSDTVASVRLVMRIRRSPSLSGKPFWTHLTAFLLLGSRVWPAILLGAFLVNVTTEGSVLTSIGIATGNTLEGLLGASLVARVANGRRVFDRARDIFKLVLLAGLFSTMLSATIGVTSLALGGYARWTDYRAIWFTWWMGARRASWCSRRSCFSGVWIAPSVGAGGEPSRRPSCCSACCW